MAEDNKKALDTLFSYCVELRSKFTHNWDSCELLQIKDYVASFRQLDDRLLRLNGRFLEALRWDYSLLSSSVSSVFTLSSLCLLLSSVFFCAAIFHAKYGNVFGCDS